MEVQGEEEKRKHAEDVMALRKELANATLKQTTFQSQNYCKLTELTQANATLEAELQQARELEVRSQVKIKTLQSDKVLLEKDKELLQVELI